MLWLGTDSGLYQFDGLRFTPFEPAPQDPQFPSIIPLSLKAAQDGSIWIGFGFGGIAQVRNNRVVCVYGHADGLPDGAVWQLEQSKSGSMIAVVRNHLFRLAGEHWEEDSAAEPLKAESVQYVFYDRDGGAWAASLKGIWHLGVGASRYERVGDSDGIVYSIVQSNDQSIWIAAQIPNTTEATLRRIDLPQAQFSGEPPIKFDISRVLFASDGMLWAQSNSRGLVRFDPKNLHADNLFSDTYGHANGLSANGTAYLFEDLWKNIWVGTSRGLDRFRNPTLVRAYEFESQSSDILLTGCPSGEMWTANKGGPLRSIREGVSVERLPSTVPYVLYCDASNVVWFGDNTSFSRFRNYRRELLPLPVEEAWMIRQVIDDRAGGLYASVLRAGLWRFTSNAWAKVKADGFPEDTPSALFMTSDGQLWAGYIDNTIAVLQGDRATRFSAGDHGAVGVVLTFCETPFGLIAAGTNGLSLFRDQRFQPLLLSNATAARGVSGVLAAKNGDLWLNGAHGISRIPASEIRASVSDHDHRARIDLYSEAGVHGPSSEAEGLPSALMDGSGLMWFATSDAIVTVDSTHVRDSVAPPILGPLSVTNDGAAVFQPYTFSRGNHTIRIQYRAFNLSEPERVSYQIELEGLDKGWQDVGNRTEAVYTSLRPGTYRFHVRASSGENIWTAADAPLELTVKPAFYQAAWFLASCAAALMLLTWLLLRLRVRQLTSRIRNRANERADERVRIARDLHDTLLQGIQGLILRFHVAIQEVPHTMPARALFDGILGRADSILAEARDRVTRLRIQTVATIDLADEFRDMGAELNYKNAIDFQVECTKTAINIFPFVAEELSYIGREAITNAFRHAHASQILVKILFDRRKLLLSVRDNGCGFHPDNTELQAESHWGLLGMMERAHRINAKFECKSVPGSGTEIIASIPARRAYLPVSRRTSENPRATRQLIRRAAAQHLNLSEPCVVVTHLMFHNVHRAAAVVRLVREKLPHYAPLLRDDLHEFRNEIVRAAVGTCVAGVAALLFASFLSIAIIIAAWRGPHRSETAWSVCLFWAALASAGLWYAYKAASGPLPFRRLSAVLTDDHADLLALFDAAER